MKKILFIFTALIFSISLSGQADEKEKSEIHLESSYFNDLRRSNMLSRETELINLQNKIIRATGEVISIDQMERYHHSYRVILKDSNSAKHNITIKYYLFIKNKDSIDLLLPGALLEFSGQIMAVTPVNTHRDSYILDVVYESGSVLIDN